MGQLIRSSDDLILHAGDGSEKQPGDIILMTNGVERARISSQGGGSGLIGGAFASGVTLNGNGTSATQRVTFPVTSAAAPGIIDYKENLFVATLDPTVYFGVNQDANGNLVTAGQPGLSWCVEGDYDDGTGTHKMEAYLQYQDAARTGGIRPIFIQMNRPLQSAGTSQTTAVVISGGDVRIAADKNESDSSATRVQVKPNNINLFPNTGTAPVAGVKILQLNADGTQGSQFYMGFASTIDVLRLETVSTTQWAVRAATKVLGRFYKAGGTSGVGVAIGGVDDNSAVLLVDSVNRGAAGDPTLVARAAASQTADIFQAQQHTSNTVLFAISAAGIPQWTAAANQQTTVGAAGAASALPATPSKYLKVIDSAGTTFVVPCYAAS